MKIRLITAKKAFLISTVILLSLTLPSCDGCPVPQITFKTIELQPSSIGNAPTNAGGSEGWCISDGNIPASPFSPGPGQIMVGFDNFFRPGTEPFPCHDVRSTLFFGSLDFDLSQFDATFTAELLFDAQNSIVRTGGGRTTTENPAQSHATVLGLAPPPGSPQAFLDPADLPPGPNVSIVVTTQVRNWVTKQQPNFGFIVAGPAFIVDKENLPRNNEAKVTWYGNFRLKVTYNPATNPRAPQ